MSIDFKWSIGNLERNLEDGYVYTAHYTVYASDGTYESSGYGQVGFEKPDTLIPYKDLTEEQVVGWVKTAIGGDEKVKAVEDQLTLQINEQKTPTSASGKPWSES